MFTFDPRSWVILGLLIALASALGFAGVQSSRLAAAKLELAEYRAEVERDRAAQHAEAAEEGRQNAQETLRRITKHQETQHAYDARLARAEADARRARAAAGQLRQQAATLAAAARGAAGDPAAPSHCPTASAAAGVLADLLILADERAGILAEALDRSHAAGLQCVAAFEALRPAPVGGAPP